MAARRSPVLRGTLAGAIAVLLGLALALVLPHGGGRALVADGTDAGADGAAVLVPHAASAAATACPLPASRSGLCGTVAGFSGWYGSWTTAGDLGAFCLEHAKSEPRPSLDYVHRQTARGNVDAPVETQQRLGYLLGRYGGTSDPTRAAALAILVHAAEGDTLTTGELAGYATSLPPAVRSTVLTMWQEAADLHGPYVASLAVTGSGGPAGSGGSVTGVLSLRSASGHPVPGMPVSWDASPVGTGSGVTDSAGSAKLTVAGSGSAGGTVTLHAGVSGLPQDDFAVWIPTDSSVQRVAVPLPTMSVQAVGSWTSAPSPGSLQIVKHTDDPAFVSPAGAVFAVVNSAGATVSVVTAGADGTAPVVGVLQPGNYQVVEQTPCGGCALAVPVAVAVTPGVVAAVAVTDHAVAHQLTLRKLTPDGQPLAGAVLHARGQSAPGAVYDQDLGTCTTAADGSCALTGGNMLAPQTVQVTEETPAPGTVLATPAVQVADLTAGDATVTFVDPRLVSVGFRKTDDAPGSVVNQAHESLAGAVFVVSGSGSEVGRCTTGGDGTCVLPGSPLVEGTGYSWAEAVAPPGFALDPAVHTFTAGCDPSCAQVLHVADAGRYADVSLLKHAAGSDLPVPGAIVDLCAGPELAASLAATYAAPAGSACAGAGTDAGGAGGAGASSWVATATTGSDGRADFGLLPPGVDYCAIERTAPLGWELASTPVCGDLNPAGSLGDAPPTTLVLDLAEQRTPVAPQSVVPPVPPVPTPVPSLHPVPVVPTAGAARVPKRRVSAVATTRPVTRPATPRGALSPPATSPPVRRAPLPAGGTKPPELAYTGTQDVGRLTIGGLGLVAAGLTALLAAAGLSRRQSGRGRPGHQRADRRPGGGAGVWGGWVPGR